MKNANKYSLKKQLLVERAADKQAAIVKEKSDDMKEAFLKLAGPFVGKDLEGEEKTAVQAKKAYELMEKYFKAQYGDEVGKEILTLFKKRAPSTRTGDTADIQALGLPQKIKGNTREYRLLMQLYKFFIDLEAGELAIEGVRTKMSADSNAPNGIKFSSKSGSPYSPPDRDTIVRQEFELTSDVDEKLFLSKTASDRAEELAATIMGGWAVGGAGYSYDAMDSKKNKWEVKMFDKFGQTARLGAGGAVAGAADLTRVRTFLDLAQAARATIDADLKSPNQAGNTGFLADRENAGTKAVKLIQKNLISILDHEYGRSTPTNIVALAGRGELTTKRIEDVNKKVEETMRVLNSCEALLDKAALKTAKIYADELNKGGQSVTTVRYQAADKRFKELLDKRINASNIDQVQAAVSAVVDSENPANVNPDAKRLAQLAEAQEYLCKIASILSNHPYSKTGDVPEESTFDVANQGVTGPAGFADFMGKYCDATLYSEAEKQKKKLHGFVFVIKPNETNAKGKTKVGKVFQKGTKIIIMTKAAIQDAARAGTVTTGGFTQQTPSIAITQ